MSHIGKAKRETMASKLTEKFAGRDAIDANRTELATLDPVGYLKAELDLIRVAKGEAEKEVQRVLEELQKNFHGQFTRDEMKTIASRAGERYYMTKKEIISAMFPTNNRAYAQLSAPHSIPMSKAEITVPQPGQLFPGFDTAEKAQALRRGAETGIKDEGEKKV